MPTIRIEYEVPDDCEKCEHRSSETGYSLCQVFDNYYLKRVNGKLTRCQACIDAEVKEG